MSRKKKAPRRVCVKFTPALIVDERDELIVASKNAIDYLQALLKLRGKDPMEQYIEAKYKYLQVNGGREAIYDDGSRELIQEPRRERT